MPPASEGGALCANERTYGSARGVPGDRLPYRDWGIAARSKKRYHAIMSSKDTYAALAGTLGQLRLAVAAHPLGENIGQLINKLDGLLVQLNSDLHSEAGLRPYDPERILNLERELIIMRTALEKALPVLRQYEAWNAQQSYVALDAIATIQNALERDLPK